MEVSALAASAVATTAQQTRDGFAIAALKIANQQDQMIADMVAQSADAAKAETAEGVGGKVDKLA
ncbi:hypothetical protein [Hansschlegelia sp. KR7-227]|uniref:hypothetical protein n=1 Tax=Hansschlegelia sp. KR7-227 TaxID=3400914 RepID=UPI003C08F7DF